MPFEGLRVPPGIPSRRVEYPAGAEVLWGMEENSSLLLLEAGTVDLVFCGPEGESLRIFRYTAPDLLGEVEVLTDRRQQLQIVAVEPSVLIEVPRAGALRWMEQDFSFCLQVMRRLCEKLMDDTGSRIDCRYRTCRERYLAAMAEHCRRGTLAGLTKAELCEELGVPLRSLNRVIAQCADRYRFYKGRFWAAGD